MSPNPPPPTPQQQPPPTAQPAAPPPYAPQQYPPQGYPPQYAPGAYPAPAYYAQPVYAAPVIMAAPGQNTFSGLKWLRYAVTLALVVNGLGIVIGILAATALSSIGTLGITAFSGSLIALLAVTIIAGVMALVTFILGMIGYYYIHQGKTEFGEPHVQSVKRSTMWFGIACGAYLANFVAGLFLSFGSFFGGVPSVQSIVNTMIISGIVEGVIGLAFIFAAAMVMQLILERLMNAQGRARRSIFVMLSMVGGIISLVIHAAMGVILSGSLTSAGPLAALNSMSAISGVVSLVGAVSLITMFLYLRQLASAEQGARTMISTGRYDPDGGVPAAPAAAPAAPPM